VKISDEDLLKTAHKYGIMPDSLKCHVFYLLDQGMSRREIRFALRQFRDMSSPSTFANTIRKYSQLWEEAQRKGDKTA